MPIIKDELGRTISVDKHEDRGVILPTFEPLSIADHADTIRMMQGDAEHPEAEAVTTARDAGKMIDETDKGGAKTKERTNKARREEARAKGQAKRKADDAKDDDRKSPQNVDLSGGVRPEDEDDLKRGGVDTMKTPTMRREQHGTSSTASAHEQMK